MPTVFLTQTTESSNALKEDTFTPGLVGWALAGAFTRCWSLSMQLKPLLYRPQWHAVWALGFVGLGYTVNQLESKLLLKMDQERDKLVKRRMLRLQAQEAQ
ncbi:hypothetical protein DFS34DRAFT_79785 [Phlyctochytrium arcticum]|nr:hypothetical protein DFS34DRAFT_79785 [Phlyctochytrium arcticum]